MSAVVVPPPNSSSLARYAPTLTARARALLTEMNLHFAGVAALLVIVIYLAIHLVIVSHSLTANNADARANQQIALIQAKTAALPLHNIDAKLEASTRDADNFYAARLPYGYAEIAAELGVLTKRTGVKLGHVQYSQEAGLDGPNPLTTVRMDAAVSGEYRPIVEFVNALERDKHFFVINSLNLSGQQSGAVNLRIRMSTDLRLPNEKEATLENALPDDVAASAATTSTLSSQPATTALSSRPAPSTLSSRPERSGVERPAVSSGVNPNQRRPGGPR